MSALLVRRSSGAKQRAADPVPPAARAAPARATRPMPRFLRGHDSSETVQRTPPSADAAAPVLVQRDETSSGPTLLDEQLTLDPELEDLARRLGFRNLLDPDWLSRSVLSLPYLDQPEFLTAPVPKAPPPIVPRGAGPKEPKAAKPGDLLSGILKLPSVKKALDRLGDDAADQASRDWGALSRGEKGLVVSGGLVLGGGLVTGIISDPGARGFLLGQLNGRVLPIPYTKGTLGFELNTKGDDVMLGLHLDVGRFLPSRFGFGPGKAKPIGGPPRPESITGGLSRKASCSCGGACDDCGGVRLSRPGDPDELEADRVADHITRSLAAPVPVLTIGRAAAVRREALEEEDEEQDVRRKVDAGTAPAARDAGGRIRRLAESGGEPLPRYVRSLFEHRLGADLSRVRVHTDGEAAQLAAATNARAFTVGRSIAFGSGQYTPDSAAGRHLLAHELAHVLQQNPAEPITASTKARRKIAVHDPAGAPPNAPAGDTNESIVRDYIAVLCPSFDVSGAHVTPRAAGTCPVAAGSAMATACACMCDMHALVDGAGNPVTWTIVVNDADWPHTDDSTKTVTVHSPFSRVDFTGWSPGDRRAGVPVHLTEIPNWLALGHELCGHAHLHAQGLHPTGPAPRHGGRPSHDPTVTIENQIRAEAGIPASKRRGLFADPHHGESVAVVIVSGFAQGSHDVTTLPSDSQTRLDTAESFITTGGVLIDLIGHADTTGGSSSENRRISGLRARSVLRELRSRGISRRNFRAIRGVGDRECTAAGDQPACRKVEIRMFIMEGGSIRHP
jgi:outer membrane protein OmpA-like peptidoglycan-associated protein